MTGLMGHTSVLRMYWIQNRRAVLVVTTFRPDAFVQTDFPLLQITLHLPLTYRMGYGATAPDNNWLLNTAYTIPHPHNHHLPPPKFPRLTACPLHHLHRRRLRRPA